MNYELAKQLKDAGFPQNGNGEPQYFKDGVRDRTEFGHRYERLYIPTLEELIEACGDGFNGLHKAGTAWLASTLKGTGEFDGAGETPTEAVARLWLALQDNQKNV